MNELFYITESEDDEEKKKRTEERLQAYHAKKATKKAVIAKTSVVLDIKPWDDETDMTEMLNNVKTIEKDGKLFAKCYHSMSVRNQIKEWKTLTEPSQGDRAWSRGA